MADQQLLILRGLWPLLKAGGTLLYATCSIFDEENSQVVHRFLDDCQNAELVALDENLGQPTDCGRQLLPSTDGTDGLFYARLRKPGQAH